MAMYSSVGEASQQAHGQPKTLLGTARLMWRVMAAIFLQFVLTWGCNDLIGAFNRSIVVCDQPVPHKGVCPRGSKLGSAGACEAVDHRVQDWSGSKTCLVKSEVVNKGVALSGLLSLVTQLAAMLSQVFVGAAMVDRLGRKPVVLIGMSSYAFFGFVLCLSSSISATSRELLIVGGGGLTSLADCFMVAALAIVSDLAQGDPKLESLGFATANIVRHAGVMFAFGAGYPVLRANLASYTVVWMAYTVVAILATTFSAMVLRESLSRKANPAAQLLAGDVERSPARPNEAVSADRGSRASGQTVNAVGEMIAALRLMWQDYFLLGLVLAIFASNVANYGAINTSSGYAIGVLGMLQSIASFSGVFQPAAIMLGSALTTRLFDALGAWGTLFLAHVVMACSLVVTGLGSVFLGAGQGLYWLGWISLGVGFGLCEPAILVILSRRAHVSNHGKVFALKLFFEKAGTGAGSYLWSHYLFQAVVGAGFRSGLVMFVSGFIHLFLLLVLLALYLAFFAYAGQHKEVHFDTKEG